MNQIVKLFVFLSLVPSVFIHFFPGKIAAISILCSYPLMMLFIPKVLKMNKYRIDGWRWIHFFWISNIIILFAGVIQSHSNDEWTTILYTSIPLGLLMPLAIYIGVQNNLLKISFNFFIKIIIFVTLLFLLKTNSKTASINLIRNLSPIYIFILFIPYLNFRKKYFIIAIALFSFFIDFTVRSNILNLSIAFLIMITYYCRNWMFPLLKRLRIVLLLSPIIFTFLGVTGTFNVFRISEFVAKHKLFETQNTEEILIDSRTAIFEDVFSEIEKQNAYFLGLGAAGKTPTSLADNLNNVKQMETYKNGRSGTESGMLNYFQWGGLLGFFAYFSLFIVASYYGVLKSNNWLCKMIGLWISYKGFFSFIEDRLSFSLATLFLFISIGMCLNRVLREMNDHEIKLFIRSFFTKQHTYYKIK
jgi:hypothetical protein